MQEALVRHENKEAVVIPVILRPCNWQNLPFGKLQSATKDGRPAEKYQNLDDAFLEITKSIEVVAKKLSASKGQSKAITPTFSDLYLTRSRLRIFRTTESLDSIGFLPVH